MYLWRRQKVAKWLAAACCFKMLTRITFTILGAVEVLIGLICSLPLLLFTLATKGARPFQKHLFTWNQCKSVPFGKSFFSSLICFFAPYSASISPLIIELTETTAAASIVERPWLKNPFNSVHAVALTNLGELTSGVLVVCALQNIRGAKGIVTKLSTTYVKKARGIIIAKAAADLSDLPLGDSERIVTTTMTDSSGAIVATLEAVWKFTRKNAGASYSESKKEK